MADSTHQVKDHVVESRTALVRFAQTRPVTLFFLLTYPWTWTLWLGVGSLMPDDKAESYGILAFVTGAFGPTVAAFITRWLADRDLKICRVWTDWSSLHWSGVWLGRALRGYSPDTVGSDRKGAYLCSAVVLAFALEHVRV
jgi:hypothetical protein